MRRSSAQPGDSEVSGRLSGSREVADRAQERGHHAGDAAPTQGRARGGGGDAGRPRQRLRVEHGAHPPVRTLRVVDPRGQPHLQHHDPHRRAGCLFRWAVDGAGGAAQGRARRRPAVWRRDPRGGPFRRAALRALRRLRHGGRGGARARLHRARRDAGRLVWAPPRRGHRRSGRRVRARRARSPRPVGPSWSTPSVCWRR